jgi:hypothetical protein
MSKKTVTIVLLVLLLLVVYAAWRILPYLPLFPKEVRLRSALYLRSPHVYTQSPVGYDPAQPPLAPEWVRLRIEREKSQAFFESSTGETVRVTLGKPRWVSGCENQYAMEAFPLAGELSLGSLTFRQPLLIVVCDMWSVGQKIRPARVVLWEGPIAADNVFYMGVQCHPGGTLCLVFAEALGDLVTTVIDAGTGQPLPAAQIVLSGGMGIQEFTGGFRLPLYTSIQVAFQIHEPGYVDRTGEIQNVLGTKLSILDNPNPNPGQGQGGMFALPGYGQQVDYTFELSRP